MKRSILSLLSAAVLCLSQALAQTQTQTQTQTGKLPHPVFAAKTVIIFNSTHNQAVEDGAIEALKRWGKLTVVDDPDLADITLNFDRKGEHQGASSDKPDKDGHPSASYSMTFGSSVHMSATLKGSTTPFYNTTTSDSKKKAGATCVTDLQQAYVAGP